MNFCFVIRVRRVGRPQFSVSGGSDVGGGDGDDLISFGVLEHIVCVTLTCRSCYLQAVYDKSHNFSIRFVRKS
jgi:hypothetical protein